MLVAGAAVFVSLALGAAAGGNLSALPASDPGFLVALLYLGIGCSILAFFMAATSIAKLGVNRAATFVGLSTVVTVACGGLFLHEQLGAWQLVGAAVIIAGVCIANVRADASWMVPPTPIHQGHGRGSTPSTCRATRRRRTGFRAVRR